MNLFTVVISELKQAIHQGYYNIPNSRVHGMDHASRVADNISMLLNLYRQFGYQDACNLTDREERLLYIAGLLHDSGREGEGRDIWENQSADKCYSFLIESGVSEQEAQEFSNLIKEKDNKNNRDLKRKLLHDADCLDVMRVRRNFKIEELSIYQDYRNDQELCHQIEEMVTKYRDNLADQGKLFKGSCDITFPEIEFQLKKSPVLDNLIEQLTHWKRNSSRGNFLTKWFPWFRRPACFRGKNGLDNKIEKLRQAIIRKQKIEPELIDAVLVKIVEVGKQPLNQKRKTVLNNLNDAINIYATQKKTKNEEKENESNKYLNRYEKLTSQAKAELGKREDSRVILSMLEKTQKEIDERMGKDESITDVVKIHKIYTEAAVKLLRGKKPLPIPVYYHMTQEKALESVNQDGRILPSGPNHFHQGGIFVSRNIESDGYGSFGIAFNHSIRASDLPHWNSCPRVDRENWRVVKNNIPLDRRFVSRIIINHGMFSKQSFVPRGIPVLTLEQAKLEHNWLQQIKP